MNQHESRERARAIIRDYYDRGDLKGWFEALYAQANFDPSTIPWADSAANESVVQWLDREKINGNGRRAMVVGCGLGDDAEEFARRGFDVTAFDISPTAIEWCRQRFPNSNVNYAAADLFAMPKEWQRAFEFVLEINTLQTMRGEMLQDALSKVADLVKVGGELLIICRGRHEDEATGDLPWPLLKSEFDQLASQKFKELSFEDILDDEEPPIRRFRALYRRQP